MGNIHSSNETESTVSQRSLEQEMKNETHNFESDGSENGFSDNSMDNEMDSCGDSESENYSSDESVENDIDILTRSESENDVPYNWEKNDKDIFQDCESESDVSDESVDNDMNQDEHSEDEDANFWTILIRSVVSEIYMKRKALGKTGFLPGLTTPEQMTEGKYLSSFIKRLRLKYNEIEEMHEASCKDPVIELIEDEIEEQKEDSEDGSFESDDEELAWEKYKPLVKKRILQNLDEIDVLISE